MGLEMREVSKKLGKFPGKWDEKREIAEQMARRLSN